MARRVRHFERQPEEQGLRPRVLVRGHGCNPFSSRYASSPVRTGQLEGSGASREGRRAAARVSMRRSWGLRAGAARRKTVSSPTSSQFWKVPRMERHLYLARHGETDWNAVGRWQGRTTSRSTTAAATRRGRSPTRSRGLRYSMIVTSNLSRAKETATIVSRGPRRRASRAGPGAARAAFRGLRGAHARGVRAAPRPRHSARGRPIRAAFRRGPGSHDAVLARVIPAARKIADRLVSPGEAALIVSHGGAIRAFLRRRRHAGDADSERRPLPDRVLRLRIHARGAGATLSLAARARGSRQT